MRWLVLTLAVQGINRAVGLLVLAFFVCLALVPGIALAEEPLQIEELYLSVWPEYYTPDVVVSQAASFVNTSSEPVGGEIWFQLPMTVEPVTLAELDNGIAPKYFEVVDKGDHQLVRYEPAAPIEPGGKLSLLLEYRYPRFQEPGQRVIPVEFVSKYPVNRLDVEIKQPLRSTEFVLSPDYDGKSMDSEGFDVYRYSYAGVQADQKLEFQISYSKEDNLPSLDPEPAAPPVTEERQGGMNTTTVALLVLAFLAVLGITLVLALRGNQRGVPQAPKGKKTGAGKASAAAGAAKGSRRDKKPAEPVDQRKKLRKMLLEGKINEKTYEKLLAELDKDK